MMAIQRAILEGSIADLVQVRNMFTCEVIESGGDTSAILWEAYMSSILDTVTVLVSTSVHFYEYIVETYTAGDWIPSDAVALDEDGVAEAEPLPYQSALVLIGKAAGLRGIGRKFISGIGEDYGSAGVMIASYLIDAALVLAAYVTPFEGLGGGTITPGILDKSGSFRPFVSGWVSSLLGTMRRRKPGVGI
jgi:hypothetical protein